MIDAAVLVSCFPAVPHVVYVAQDLKQHVLVLHAGVAPEAGL